MNILRKQYFLLFLIWSSVSEVALAQDFRYEIGVTTGLAFYMGDANPNIPFKNSYPVAGLQARYNSNPRWSIKGLLAGSKISGAIENPTSSTKEQIFFERSIWNIGCLMEFNFLEYGISSGYRKMHSYSPFISVGMGWLFSPVKQINYTGLNIPFGVGFRYKVSDRVNLITDFSVYKLFTDKLDVTGTENMILNDPSGIKSSILKNKDWYFLWTFSVTWSLGYQSIYCK